MRKIFAVLAVLLTIGAVVPVSAQAADRTHGNQFYDAGAGGGGRLVRADASRWRGRVWKKREPGRAAGLS